MTGVQTCALPICCISRSDVFEGWREHRESGGVIVDVTENKIVCEGLSMPHSPRWHNGKLWLLNSGTGELGHVDLDSGTFKPLCFLPGYARGLNFVNDRLAIVGLSKPRKDEAFSGLPLDGELKRREVAPRSGFCVIDLQTGDVLYWAKIEGKLVELYDVGVLHGVRSARAVSFASDEQRQAISIEETKGREGIV